MKVLSLLSTSRQIHAEAFLLPYYLNTFSFDRLNEFELIRHLTPKQQAAISEIELVTNYGMAWAGADSSPSRRGQIMEASMNGRFRVKSDLGVTYLDLLPGIKKVTVVVRMQKSYTLEIDQLTQRWETLIKSWILLYLGDKEVEVVIRRILLYSVLGR
ncbi:hypothetical protein P280DRAFT_553868 [Massarina eburnea CBS 473.64]|uniref:Uncharacterized protein n=1 Tax=Massarina eburnea CBS 473.64 TaxID=1395130 RepID=A0A6A6RLI5_9PLEO|nr:hypothetical protein P280DRAFT_553868 [Massarina eburnea CBS 473.64]